MTDHDAEPAEPAAKPKSAEEMEKLVESLSSALRSLWLAGLGVPSAAAERGSEIFQYLVEKGEKIESESKERLKSMGHTAGHTVETVASSVEDTVRDLSGKARSLMGKGEEALEQKVVDTLKTMGVPSREDIQALTQKVEELSAKIDELHGARRRKAEKEPGE